MHTKLSVNINKFATLRNSRGGNNPDVVKAAQDAERFGADGITVHPRPDQRHISYDDVFELKKVVTTEFNIEGNPLEEFIKLVLQVKPNQVTLVPDADHALTSDQGWDTITHASFLKDIISQFRENNIRVSIFCNANERMVEAAKATGTDRVELYTGPYAHHYNKNRNEAVKDYINAANVANNMGLGINAGHDLDLNNLEFFKQQIPNLLEVSIGHALICDSIYYGFENTIQMYKRKLKTTI
ncbi:MAG: pyridoxine 5'-phosphate synthase [Bacteroidota bacterium]|nr:pyridoxine 5'-phosphate synthase [Bacteroidota bacterium]